MVDCWWLMDGMGLMVGGSWLMVSRCGLGFMIGWGGLMISGLRMLRFMVGRLWLVVDWFVVHGLGLMVDWFMVDGLELRVVDGLMNHGAVVRPVRSRIVGPW